MDIDVLSHGAPWTTQQQLAHLVEAAGFSGVQVTEIKQPPWTTLTATSLACPSLDLATAVAVAFARSPMATAATAWELAENTGGRFRLGLGSQVRAHIERRYGMEFDPPVARLREYVQAVQACWRAFRQEEALSYTGDHYQLSLLPEAALPRRHDHENLQVDIAAVGPVMCRMAGAVADGAHVHPFHSEHYVRHRFLPQLAAGAQKAGRDPEALTVTVPVFAAAGDSEQQRATLREQARKQIAFYGTTRNYAFMFDDLGFDGTSARLSERLKAGDTAGMSALITDEILDHFAIVCPWDELAGRLLNRYHDIADRLVMYLAADQLMNDPEATSRWREVTTQIRAAAPRSARATRTPA